MKPPSSCVSGTASPAHVRTPFLLIGLVGLLLSISRARQDPFAAQAPACTDAWGVDLEIVNTWGGAVALGHPLGASGTRLIGTLAARLRTSGARWGAAALCIGVGQGLAVVLENTEAS